MFRSGSQRSDKQTMFVPLARVEPVFLLWVFSRAPRRFWQSFVHLADAALASIFVDKNTSCYALRHRILEATGMSKC